MIFKRIKELEKNLAKLDKIENIDTFLYKYRHAKFEDLSYYEQERFKNYCFNLSRVLYCYDCEFKGYLDDILLRFKTRKVSCEEISCVRYDPDFCKKEEK